MERSVKFKAGYSNAKHGRHGVEIRFLLKGDKGVIQFVIYTDWTPTHDKGGLKSRCADMFPMAADLGYHSYVPRYEGHTAMTDSCPYLDGKTCYYDGSGLNAEPILTLLTDQGDEAVWEALEKFYAEVFEEVAA